MSRSIYCLVIFGALLCSPVTIFAEELPDQNEECVLQDSEETVILDTTQEATARRCYVGASSIIRLQCDWQNHAFQVTLNGSARSDFRELAQVPWVTEFSGRGARNGKVRKAVSRNSGEQCPAPWSADRLVIGNFGFLRGEGELQPRLTIVDGKLYYKTSIYLWEDILTDDCGYVTQHETRIDLSCCAEPLPAVVAPVVTAPLVGECSIDDCDRSNFGCYCEVRKNALLVKINASDSQMIPGDVDYQLVSLTAAPAGLSATYRPPVVLFPFSASTGLGVQQCGAHAYASQNLILASHRDLPIELTCNVQYCTKDAAQVTSQRPLCNAASTPKPAYCSTTAGL